ncbi:unnamed protein product [Chironomus riparius]|uniref:Uncharacterized protein n=1 Tax=Chironomus riparius TaxID=315576 RepID=A0A9N9S8X1_9DIPT|nr:unnamed protein product [Chironomus riparius]
MKSVFYLFGFASLIFVVIAQPSCNFNFDTNSKYFCPLTGGNIDASYDGEIGGAHFENKADNDVLFLYADEAVKEFILKKIFDRFKNLEILEFRKGSISAISKDFFYNCNRLQKVLIKESVFVDVPVDIFGNCTAITEIDFGNNNIDNIESRAFAGLENLEILRLNENELKAIRPNVFSPLTKLQTLDLSKNNLKNFDANVFLSNTELRVLILAENKLDRLDSKYFNSLKQLTSIDLTKNVVNSTEKTLVDNLVGINSVKFKENSCIDLDFENFKQSDIDDFKTCIENFNGAPIMILSSVALVLLVISKLL